MKSTSRDFNTAGTWPGGSCCETCGWSCSSFCSGSWAAAALIASAPVASRASAHSARSLPNPEPDAASVERQNLRLIHELDVRAPHQMLAVEVLAGHLAIANVLDRLQEQLGVQRSHLV